MKKLLLFILVSTPIISWSQSQEAKFTIEPLYGLETSYVAYPSPGKYVTRGTYGARLLYGLNKLSFESELTQTKSNEFYQSQDKKVDDTSNRLSVGIRSTLPLHKFVGIYVRTGARASQGETEITTAGVKETKDSPLLVNPYGGAGLQVAVSSYLALNIGVTFIRNAENKFDQQWAAALSTRFGSIRR
ncbi:MAG TPA: outer membrane beta-barrel protein [Bacteriovoracaceae bacterium]|nr:outer membrane beta-barrel protein [Bacteriovoracaceae bacterium]